MEPLALSSADKSQLTKAEKKRLKKKEKKQRAKAAVISVFVEEFY